MKKQTAKLLGYEVIDEFGFNIAPSVTLEFKNNKVEKVIDEFGFNIILRVKVLKK